MLFAVRTAHGILSKSRKKRIIQQKQHLADKIFYGRTDELLI